MTRQTAKETPAAADDEAPAAQSIDDRIEETRKANELLKLEVEQRKLRAVLADLDDKARIKQM